MVLPVTTIYRMGFCEETFWGLEKNYHVRLRQQLMAAEFDVQILCLFFYLPAHFFVCIVFTHSFFCVLLITHYLVNIIAL